jgi:predicted small secreted protein
VAKALLALALLTSVGAALSACHTVEGAGEDISNTGRAVQRAF